MVTYYMNCVKMASYSAALQRPFVAVSIKDGELVETLRVCTPTSQGYYGEIPTIIVTPPTSVSPPKRLQRSPRIVVPNNARTRAIAQYEEAAKLGRITGSRSACSSRFLLYMGKNKYTPAPLLRLAKQRREYAEVSHTQVWENCDIPKGIAQPTSGRQIKKKTPSASFSHDMLVDEHIPLAPLPIRSSLLLHKLQVKILQQRCREMPTTTTCRALARMLKSKRVARFTRKIIRYARCHCNLCRMRTLLMKSTTIKAEGEGWFKKIQPTVEHKLAPDTQTFLEGAINNIKASVSEKVDDAGKKIIDSLTSVGGILLTAATANNKVSWTVGILSSFVVVGVLNTQKMAEITTYLTSDSKKHESSRATTTAAAQGPSLAEQNEYQQTDNISRGLTLLFQTIGTYCGVMDDKFRKHPSSVHDWSILFTKNFQQAARSHIGMLSFFRNFVEVVKQMLKYIYFKMNPGAESIIAFWEHSSICRAIIKEVDQVLATPLYNFASADNMAMLESCLILVNEIIIRIGTIDGDSASGTLLSYFMKLKSDLISLKSKCNLQGYSAVARETPYAIAIAGDRGIGKSNVLNEIAAELSTTCEVSENVAGKVYSKRLGSKFYDGHTNEEIILFDDFCQIQTATPDDSDAQDIFQIITDQPFRPNMAIAEEKGKIVDVKLVLMAMNNPFPKINFLSDQQALWRRRNRLIHMRIKGSFPDNNSVYDKEFKHVEFGIYGSTTDSESKPANYMNLKDLIVYLKDDAKKYKLAQKSKVQARVNRALNSATIRNNKRKEPLSVEALQNALKEALYITNTDTIWDKYCRASYENKVVQWMKKRLSFLYAEPKDDEAQKEIEKRLDEAFEQHQQSQAVINEHVYADYLTSHQMWSHLTADQQKIVQNFWEKDYPDVPFCPPAQAEGEGSETIYADEDTVPSIRKQKNDTHDKFTVFNMNHHLSKNSKYAKTQQDLSSLSYYILKSNINFGKPLDDKMVDATIDFIEGKSATCKHCKAGVFVYSQVQHCALTDNKVPFIYYNCQLKEEDKQKCILSNKVFLQTLQVISPDLYSGTKKFAKTFDSYKALKIESWRIPVMTVCNMKLITEWCRKTYQKYKPTLSNTFKWLWKFLKWVLLLLAPIAIIIGVIFSFKGWSHAKDDEDTSYTSTVKNLAPHLRKQASEVCSSYGKSLWAPYQGITETEATYTIVPRQPSGNIISRNHITGKSESNSEKDIFKLFKNATTFFYVHGRNRTTGDLTSMNLRVFRIGGNYFLLPKHYITYMNTLDLDSLSISTMVNNNTYRLNIKAFKYLDITGSEMMILTYDAMPRSRDLRTHFATQEIWEAAPIPNHMRILEINTDGTMDIFEVNPRIVRDFGITCYNEIMATYGEVMHYRWAGEGRCMSIIVDDSLKIRGFHIAGDHKSSGYAAIVTKDLLMELGNIVNPPVVPFIEQEDVPKVMLDGIVHTIGKVQAKYEIHLPNKTAIRESEIHGIFPVRTVPAPLIPCKENNFTDPLIEGIKKHGMPTFGFNASDLKVVKERFTEMLLANVKPKWNDVGVRSMDVAIRGVEATPGFKSLVLSTSEGFPFMCERKSQSSKKWLIHQHFLPDGKIEYSVHSRLQEEYDKNMSLRKQGIVPPTINVDCLKDARLPIEKAYIPGKVRIFSVAPTDFVIAFRQYFADFIVSFTHAKFNFFHALGIAPETSEWSDMVLHMTEVGNKFLTGDYSNFGPGFDNAVFKLILEARLQWYETYTGTVDAVQFQEDQLVRSILNIETSEPIHLAKDLLYQTLSGMCSGSPSTTIDNCCVNIFYIMLAYYCIMSEHDPKLATLDAMYKHMRLLVFGDDVFMCVSDTICEIFNNLSLHAFFKKFNVKYTDADKTGEMRKYCSLSEASFLKRSFVKHPYNRMQMLGAVEKRSIEDCANWITKTIDIRSASIEASYAALQLAYGWGPDYFNYIRKKLWDAWFARGIRVTLRSWLDYDLMYNKRDFPLHLCAEAEGPPTSTPGEITTCDDSQDTIIQDHAVPDVECPKLTTNHITEWAGADYDSSYDRLINRYVLLQNLEWTTNNNGNEFLKYKSGDVEKTSEWPLPLAVLQNNKNTPTVLPFLQHKYATFDMTVKVIVNVNKFMVGQLQVSWYYLHNEDCGYKFRQSVNSRSQMLNAVIDAGSSNSVELCIPYKNYRPWIHINADSTLGINAELGSLSIKVLSQLDVPSTSYKGASVSVYVKFTNASFMGIIPRDLGSFKGEGEMLPMLTTMAAAYLMQQNADKNRDKPPVQLPPVHMLPMASTSLGIGTGCSEPLSAMRLDARGQVPHPDTGDTPMNIYNIAEQKGLLTNITWTVAKHSGDKLWDISVTPTPDLSYFHNEQVLGAVVTGKKPAYGYAVPPISVVAGMMTYWRGSICFDFNVVASQYHTGRLLAAFSPIAIDSITLSQAQALPYVIFDIHDERTFTFTTPYISDKPWWPCGYINGQKEETPGIGTLYLMVLNELVPMDNVAKDLNILVYMYAHPSFEVSIPRQSVWALPWNLQVAPSTSVYAKEGYYPWFISTWRYIYKSKTLCLRYGEVTDHVAQFSNLVAGITGSAGGWYYYMLDENDPNYAYNSKLTIQNIAFKDLYFIPVDVEDGWGMVYFYVAYNNLGIGSGKVFPSKYTSTSLKSDPTYGLWQVESAESQYVKGNPAFVRKLFTNTVSKDSLTDFVLSESEIQLCEPSPIVKSTNGGKLLFGESFNDLKDYSRRYEPLFRVNIPLDPKVEVQYAFSFDAIPAGNTIALDTPYSKFSRDGGQAIFASCYRFFRGSMNYKFICNSSPVNIWLEHRPDRVYTTSGIRRKALSTWDHQIMKDYAQVYNSSTVNRVTTINVPFYQAGSCGLLQCPNSDSSEYARRAYSLGELIVHVQPDDTYKLSRNPECTIDVFRSIGDDMRYYNYTGFPLLLNINQLIQNGFL